jgi:hypothetical protein
MKKLLSVFLIILPLFAFSQKTIESQELIWYGYFQKIELNDYNFFLFTKKYEK